MAEERGWSRPMTVTLDGRIGGFAGTFSAVVHGPGQIQAMAAILQREGVTPTGECARDADGNPICPRHGVAMQAREKQGDVWHSHRIVTTGGEELYCRGRAGNDSPGWYVAPEDCADASTPTPSQRGPHHAMAERPRR